MSYSFAVKPRRLLLAGAAVTLAVALFSSSAVVAADAAPMAAKAKAKVSLVGTSTVTVPAQPSLTWKITWSKKAKKAKYVLQRKSIGTSWKNITTLAKASGTIKPAKLTKLGVYQYRVVATGKIGKKTTKVTSTTKTVKAYGQVDLYDICNASNTVLMRCKTQGSIFIGANAFAYVTKVYGADRILNSATTAHSCRSLDLRFAAWESVSPGLYGPYYNSQLSVAQGSTVTSASAHAGTIGTLKASIKPGAPFTANMQMSSDSGQMNYVEGGVSGTAVCYTANGIAR